MQHSLESRETLFGDRRHIRKRGRAFQASYTQRTQLALLHQSDRGRQRREVNLHMTTEQITQRRTGPLVGNMRDLYAGCFGEQHCAEMYTASNTS
jgi:hypothetical protein